MKKKANNQLEIWNSKNQSQALAKKKDFSENVEKIRESLRPNQLAKKATSRLPLKIVDSNSIISAGGRADRYAKENGINTATADRLLKKEGLTYSDVNQDNIVTRYYIKGFEYGNWTSTEERFNFLIATRKSLEQMKDVLGFANIGMNKTIGIAFGARGNGGSAKAHFEPDTFMINLTRENGYNSFAHEYGHGLDYFFGTYIDQDVRSVALTFGRSTIKKVDLSQFKTNSLRYYANKAVNDCILDSEGNKTQSYITLEKAKSDEYWFRRNEIFARMFEQYIAYKLSKNGVKNTFLTKQKYLAATYLKQNDFTRVLPTIEKLINAMRLIVQKK